MEDTDAQGQSYWSDLEELARPARERRRLPPATRSEIIVRLCSTAPLSVKELSVLLDRSEAYVGDAIRPLVAAGDLTFLYPDQPRHPRQKYVAAVPANGTAAPARQVPPPAPPVPLPHEKFAPRQPRADTPAPPPPPPPPPHHERPTAVSPTFRKPVLSPPAGVDIDESSPSLTEEEAAVSRAPRFPNQWTNLTYVIVVGLALGFSGQKYWLLLAALAAASLSWLHVSIESAQYRRFRTLQATQTRLAAFVFLKSLVTFFEIIVVYVAALAYNGRL